MEEYTAKERIDIMGETLDKGGQLFVISKFPITTFLQFRQSEKDSYTFVWEDSEKIEDILKKCKKVKKK